MHYIVYHMHEVCRSESSVVEKALVDLATLVDGLKTSPAVWWSVVQPTTALDMGGAV